MNAIEALAAAGYVLKRDVMEPEFDYPLDFYVRESDGAMILCFVKEYDDEVMIELNPYNLRKTWLINRQDDNIDYFVADFKATFEEFWLVCKD
jgi:hypothetical protein